MNVNCGKTAVDLFQHIENIVAENNSCKLITQMYDRALVMTENIHGFKSQVLEKYPQAFHCYNHVLNLIL